MGTTVVLRGLPIELSSSAGCRFVTDCVRAAEGLITDKELVEQYEIEPGDWLTITKNRELIRAIQDERARRVRNGQAVREAAQQRLIKSPSIMDSIVSDAQANPRHRIEAAREIRATATGSDGAEKIADAGEKFVITINLGEGHVEHYEKEIKPMKPLLEDKTDD